jgi:cytoskeletal protein RodZ
MSPFAGYLFGLLVLIGGLAVAAYLLNVPTSAIVVAVVLLFVAILWWVTRRPRARPSTFTGTTPNSPSLDRTVLLELKTTLMQRSDTAREQTTTRMPQTENSRTQPTTQIARSDSRSQPTTRIDRQTEAAKRAKRSPSDD